MRIRTVVVFINYFYKIEAQSLIYIFRTEVEFGKLFQF